VTYLSNKQEKRIAMALERSGVLVKQSGRGRWELALTNGKAVAATATLAGDWLILDAALGQRADREGLLRLLALNASLRGLSKFVLPPDPRTTHVRCDIPLVEDEGGGVGLEAETESELERKIEIECAGLKKALARFHGEKRDAEAVSKMAADTGRIKEGAEQLHRACNESGWKFSERTTGRLVVDLEAEGGFYQAAVAQRNEGAQVSVDLARWDRVEETSRHALATLLLRAGGLVRMARPSIEQLEAQIEARFEIVFTAIPAAAELAHAFSALSVACSLCGREAKAVQDEVIAREYLIVVDSNAERARLSLAMPAAAD
jgi:hypothetical protein